MEKLVGLFNKYREVIDYLFFGVLATVVNLVVYFVCADVFHWNYMIANALSWLAAVLFAYVTNRTWVFKSSVTGFKGIMSEMSKFVGCRVFSGVIDMAIMFVSVSLIGIPDSWAKIITQVVVVVLNYIFSKLIIFKE